MSEIILYSTGCPACNMLKTKLGAKNISYKEENDVSVMEALGITRVPVLSVDGTMMELGDANKWINEK